MMWIIAIVAFLAGLACGFLVAIKWIGSILRSPEKVMKIAGIQGKDAKEALSLLFGNKEGEAPAAVEEVGPDEE